MVQMLQVRLREGRDVTQLRILIMIRTMTVMQITQTTCSGSGTILFYYYFILFFGHTSRLLESQFPDQGSNPGPLQWTLVVLTPGPLGNSPGTVLSALYVRTHFIFNSPRRWFAAMIVMILMCKMRNVRQS